MIDRFENPPITRRDFLFLLALGALCVAAFWPVVTFGFVNWDDRFHILDNPLFNPPRIENVAFYWTRPYYGLYVPVTYTFWTLIGIVSLQPALFHASNLALHVGCVMLVWLILRGCFRSPWPGFIGAAIFAVHPLQVEAVAWVSASRDLLAGLFSLLSIFCYLKQTRHRSTTLWLIASILCFVFAILSKPTAVVVPLILVIFARLLGRSWKSTLLDIAPVLLLAVGCGWWTTHIQTASFLDPAPIWSRPLVALDAITFYVLKLIWPVGLCFDYGRTPAAIFASGEAWITWLVPAGILVICLLAARRQRLASASALIFLAGLLPVLGLLPFDFQDKSTVADRYLYLAMLGVALGVSAVIRWRDTIAVRSIAITCAIAMGVTSYLQTWTWHDTRALAANGLSVNPQSFSAMDLLAWLAFDDKNSALAERYSRESLALKPQNVTALINLGRALALQDRAREAVAPLELAVKLRPNDAEAHASLAAAYGESGRLLPALRECERALELNPRHEGAQIMLPLLQQALRSAPATNRSP